MMREALIFANSAWNICNYRADLIDAFNKSGIKVVVVCPDNSDIDLNNLEVRKVVKVPKYDGAIVSLFVEFGYLLFTVAKMRNIKVFSFSPRANLLAGLVCFICCVPHVVTVTGLGGIRFKKKLLRRLLPIYRIFLGRDDVILAQNRQDKRLFKRCLELSESEVVYIPGSGAPLRDINEDAIVARILIRNVKKVFVYSGRALPDKGLFELLKASVELDAQGFAHHLRISVIPDKRYKSYFHRCNEIAETYSHIDMQVHVSQTQLHQIYLDADCIVLPTRYGEGTPRALLEAMDAGCCVITSFVLGCRDTVLAGENGFFCRATDVTSIADNILKIILLHDDQIESFKLKSRSMAKERFSIIKVNQYYLNVMRA